MSSQRVTIIDQSRQVVATAKVSEQDGCFAGRIDLSSMPATLQLQFQEYEEMVNQQMFSFLDDLEEKIETLFLKAVFADGNVEQLTDVQIYPSPKSVSFKVIRSTGSGRWFPRVESEFRSMGTTNSRPMDCLQENLWKVWKQRKWLRIIRATPKDRAFYCFNKRRMGRRFTRCGGFLWATHLRWY